MNAPALTLPNLQAQAAFAAALIGGVATPANGKQPHKGAHPSRYPRKAGVPPMLAAPSAWHGATGYCLAPVNGVVAIDFDDLTAYARALEVLPALARTTRVNTGKGIHLFARLPVPPRKVLTWRHAGKEMASLRCAESNSYVIGAGSLHPSGRVYELVAAVPPVTLDVHQAAALLGLFAADARSSAVPAAQSIAPASGDDFAARYASAALVHICQAISAAPEGSRNHTLFEQATSAYAFVKAGYLSESAATDGLTNAAARAGLPFGEVVKTLGSARKIAAAAYAEGRIARAAEKRQKEGFTALQGDRGVFAPESAPHALERAESGKERILGDIAIFAAKCGAAHALKAWHVMQGVESFTAADVMERTGLPAATVSGLLHHGAFFQEMSLVALHSDVQASQSGCNAYMLKTRKNTPGRGSSRYTRLPLRDVRRALRRAAILKGIPHYFAVKRGAESALLPHAALIALLVDDLPIADDQRAAVLAAMAAALEGQSESETLARLKAMQSHFKVIDAYADVEISAPFANNVELRRVLARELTALGRLPESAAARAAVLGCAVSSLSRVCEGANVALESVPRLIVNVPADAWQRAARRAAWQVGRIERITAQLADQVLVAYFDDQPRCEALARTAKAHGVPLQVEIQRSRRAVIVEGSAGIQPCLAKPHAAPKAAKRAQPKAPAKRIRPRNAPAWYWRECVYQALERLSGHGGVPIYTPDLHAMPDERLLSLLVREHAAYEAAKQLLDLPPLPDAVLRLYVRQLMPDLISDLAKQVTPEAMARVHVANAAHDNEALRRETVISHLLDDRLLSLKVTPAVHEEMQRRAKRDGWL